ncbi:MAG: AAA family ATPase [Candidatus Omnitrophota bacterium]
MAITNQKGGCGKTTTAINLAASLMANGRKVLLIDLDPQAHATSGLNVKTESNIYNVLSKITPQRSNLGDILQRVDDNFYLAPSGIVLSTLEQELAGEIGRESRLNWVLENFKSDFDYILIDCPPNLGILTINAIRASNEVVIPVEASRFSLDGLGQLLDIINLVRDRLNHSVSHRILITNFDSRLRHSFQMLERIKNTFEESLFSTIMHVNVKLKEAQNEGLHIFSYDKYCRGAKDYFSLSREIIMQEEEGRAGEGRRQEAGPHLKKIMKQIVREELPKLNNVFFSVFAPDAKDVHVVGNFNNWSLDGESRMHKEGAFWAKRINLNSGRYRYRFVIDGKWTEDPNNPSKELNPYGEMDSLLEVAKW